ncbi:MAG: FMN-binding protein [Euryarchaeota archaeon]|nr:FMN-binding protein [Euryarchaeota archaeon]
MAETKESNVSVLLKLTVIAAVAAVILTLTYGVTQEELQRRAELLGGPGQQLRDMGIVPDAASFKAVTVDGEDLYYEAFDSSGNHIGYGFIADIPGSQDVMTIAGGMDIDLKMTGVKVLAQKETPGIGDKVQSTPEFTDSFVGVGLDGLTLSSDGGKIDGISGATLSSVAVTDGVRGMVEKIQQEVG